MIKLFLQVVVASAFLQRQSQHIQLEQSESPLSITFGSCYGLYSFNSNIFSTIAATTDLFIWLGDVAYLDTHSWWFQFYRMPESYIRERFRMTKQAEGYSKIKRVIGVWDDHDYGINDAGVNFEDKIRNREIFLDFLDEPANTDRRNQKDSPIHQDYYVTQGEMVVHVILLDNRYEYNPVTGDRLGADQWQWLESQLQDSKAKQVDLTVIGTGIQIIADREWIPMESYSWQNKKRLFDILKQNEMSKVVLITGDVHFGQIYENKCRSFTGQRRLLEVTSSGLSHTQEMIGVPTARETTNLQTPLFYSATPVLMELHFGEIQVSRESVNLLLKSPQGTISEQITVEWADLEFDRDLTRFSNSFCQSKSNEQRVFMLFHQYVNALMEFQYMQALGIMAVIVAIGMSLLAVLLRAT